MREPIPQPETTLQELAKTKDNILRFWLALVGMAIVLGSGQGAQFVIQQRVTETQAKQQRDIATLQRTVNDLALTASSTAIQTQTYQQSDLERTRRIEAHVDRLQDVINRLTRTTQ